MKKIVNKSFKFRIYPNATQRLQMAKTFGCARFVYNYFLDKRIKFYEATKAEDAAIAERIAKGEVIEQTDKKKKRGLSFFDTGRLLTDLKNQPEFEWLKGPSSKALEFSLKNLDTAYQNFFKRPDVGFPKFKSKHDNYKSYREANWDIRNSKLILPKMTPIKARGINSELSNMTKKYGCAVTQSPDGKYWASVSVETELEVFETVEKEIGIDLGITSLVTCSDGRKYDNIKSLSKLEKKLKYNQRQLSKKQKGSKSRDRQRVEVCRIHNKIANVRNYHLHNITKELVKDNILICSEDLSINNMVKNHRLAKSINDCAWGELTRQIAYKSEWHNRKYVKVDKFFPSSKTCSECGFIKEEMPLNIREWECPQCGVKHDRDINAAKNILKQGKTNSTGPKEKKTRSKKLTQLFCSFENKSVAMCASDSKQKQVEALPIGEPMKPEPSFVGNMFIKNSACSISS